jgi:flagellar hook assembly protein FlgD
VPYTLDWPQFHHDYQRTGLYNWISGMRGGDANPKEFSAATTLSFTLSDTLHIQVTVYDEQANPVKTLVSQVLPNGAYHPIWDGKDDNYAFLPNGLYLIEIKVRNEAKIIPVVLNR